MKCLDHLARMSQFNSTLSLTLSKAISIETASIKPIDPSKEKNAFSLSGAWVYKNLIQRCFSKSISKSYLGLMSKQQAQKGFEVSIGEIESHLQIQKINLSERLLELHRLVSINEKISDYISTALQDLECIHIHAQQMLKQLEPYRDAIIKVTQIPNVLSHTLDAIQTELLSITNEVN